MIEWSDETIAEVERLIRTTRGTRERAEVVCAYLAPEVIDRVDVNGGMIVVETIEAYGLKIGLAANGDASEVSFPRGATA